MSYPMIDTTQIKDPVVASALEKLEASGRRVSVLSEEERQALIKMLDEYAEKEGLIDIETAS